MASDGVMDPGAEAPAKKSKLPILVGFGLAAILGGGGFYAVQSGLILAPAVETGGKDMADEEPPKADPLPDIAFVPIKPLVINLGAGSSNRHLKFEAQLEVEAGAEKDVADVLPRVIDVLNGYLRAIPVTELEEPSALIRLRAQMLRRVQIVTGEGRVRDLLIMEFVLN